jgi:hypothetical protein
MARITNAAHNPRVSWGSESSFGFQGKNDQLLRRVSAIFLIALYYGTIHPFRPISWILPLDGTSILDRFTSGILALSACYFQWQISGLERPLAINIPWGGNSAIRNGRVERAGSDGIPFIWHPNSYWAFAACEALLLAFAEYWAPEPLRRAVVLAITGGLWLIGFFATPRSVKRWAWEHIKLIWTWLIIQEVLGMGSSRGRRRRY